MNSTALYLDLLKSALTLRMFDQMLVQVAPTGRLKRIATSVLARRGMVLAREVDLRKAFAESPPLQDAARLADTLIGPVGLDNLEKLIRNVVAEDVPGDLIETGVWRGGSAIFMRGALEALGDSKRLVWAADSFEGLPSRGATGYDEDADDQEWSEQRWLAVSVDDVKRNFERFGLLDERVQFLVGWFHDTLTDERIRQISLMRVDGDMYGSTMDALRLLYPKLSVGGYVVVDDYWLPNCRAAVDAYRAEHAISDEIIPVDRAVVYWRKTTGVVESATSPQQVSNRS